MSWHAGLTSSEVGTGLHPHAFVSLRPDRLYLIGV